MARLNIFFRFCIAIILVLLILYLGTLVKYVFTPLISLLSITIIPIMLAGFFYYLLRPLVKVMMKRKINRTIAILIIYVVIAVILVGFIVGIWPSLRTQLVTFVENAPSLFTAIGTELQKLEQNELLMNLFPEGANPLSNITEYLNKGFSLLTNYVSGLFSFVSDFTVILFTFPIILFYMLKEGEKLGEGIISFIPKRFRLDGKKVLHEIDSSLSGYIVGKVIVNLALSVLMYLGFLIIDLPYALLLTSVAFIMNFIPFVGAIISTVPIFIIGFIESPGTAIWSVVIVIVAQQIQDNLIAPYVYGKNMDIHPLTTIILVLVGGDIAGMTGFLLVIPVYMAIKIVVTKVYHLFFKERWENI